MPPPRKFSDEQILAALPGRAVDVAERIGCAYETALERLKQMNDIRNRRVYICGWYKPEGARLVPIYAAGSRRNSPIPNAYRERPRQYRKPEREFKQCSKCHYVLHKTMFTKANSLICKDCRNEAQVAKYVPKGRPTTYKKRNQNHAAASTA